MFGIFIPTFTIKKNKPNVGTYTKNTWNGMVRYTPLTSATATSHGIFSTLQPTIGQSANSFMP